MRQWTVLAWAALLIGCAPIGPIPGGRLGGSVSAPPESWESLQPYGTLQLESRPDAPYSVNVWGAGIGRSFYVACRPDSRWLAHVIENPEVRLRVHGNVYELRATRSESAEIRDKFFRQLMEQYGWSPDDRDRESAWLLRLEPRSSSR